MKALPSIAFNEFSGSAGNVTARSVSGKTFLNHKAQQPKVTTASQAVRRNTLSKVSRAYKQLTDSQMKSWGLLAERMKGISTFGKAAELTAHNAFVRINSNRALAGMPMLIDAPEYKSDVPEPDYSDFWVTQDKIVFIDVEQPKPSYRLVMRMGTAQSNGVSSGWGNTVILSSEIVPDMGDVNILELYTERFGIAPEEGKKYFIEMYWMDTETGFTGESVCVSTVCNNLSHVNNVPYTPRPEMTAVNNGTSYSLDDYTLKMSGGTGLMTFEADYVGQDGVASAEIIFTEHPLSVSEFKSYVYGRSFESDYMNNAFSPMTFEVSMYEWRDESTFKVGHRGGNYEKPCDVFGCSILIKR